jgi:DNA-binding NarL/FixJ family response regulator
MKDGCMKFLIVDDNTLLLEGIKNMVRNYTPPGNSSEIFTGRSSAEALEKYEQNKPIDFALLDISLGEGPTGLELARLFREDDRGIRICMITSYDLPEYREAAREIAGEDAGFIPKDRMFELLGTYLRDEIGKVRSATADTA